jgi:integrase
MALTDVALRNAKPRLRPYKLSDAHGLFALVQPTGSILWRLKFRVAGREKKLSLGAYPSVTLAKARELAVAAHKRLDDGGDPAAEKQIAKIAKILTAKNTFAAVAEELITKREAEGVSPVTAAKARWLIARFGVAFTKRPVAEIEPFELLMVLKTIERRGQLETARRAREFASRVFRYAVGTARASRDIAADLRGAVTVPTVKHRAALIEPKAVGGLLRAIDGFEGQPSTVYALRLAPHVFTRPGELRHMEKTELDLEAAVWRIPAGKMKMRRGHDVPLSTQAVAIINDALAVSGNESYVFPAIGKPGRPLSENTINAALRRLGYSGDEMTAHGFRAMASSLLNESGKWSPDAIERALAHGDGNAVRGIYNRSAYWDERVKMAQWWSDHLDTLRKGAETRTPIGSTSTASKVYLRRSMTVSTHRDISMKHSASAALGGRAAR